MRVLRAGVTGRTQAVAAPLTLRPRGTIYEALPFILVDVFEEAPERVHIRIKLTSASSTFMTSASELTARS